MSGLFRCAGDILFDDNHPIPGQISNVQLKKYSETSNFLQYKQPLTPEHPYFFAQIRALAQKSKITLGIAGPDIDNDAHPGHWNNTVGYHSDTGKCFTSHTDTANTKGEKFSIGDMFGVLVTHFGENMSTVLFLKNGIPVATRYLFEADHSKFLPTVCLEHGPIDLGIMWPQCGFMGIPKFDEKNMLNWIRDHGVQFDLSKDMFTYDKKMTEVTIQSPVPLTKDMVHYEVIVEEAEGGESPAVGIATCSPLKPSPTSVLLRDFFRWKADGQELESSVGQRIGFGIHYNPDEVDKADFNDKHQQFVLCFVTLNMQIVFFRMMLQPPGGFFPLIVLTRAASKVRVDVETNRDLGNESTKELLDTMYREKYDSVVQLIAEDLEHRAINDNMMRKSPDVEVEIADTACVLRLASRVKRIHAIQFKQPLSPLASYFCAEIVKLNEDSAISLGVGDSEFPLNKHPGKHSPSTGYYSRDGKMYFNEKFNGNIEGERFGEGDTIGLDIRTFDDRGYSVVLIIKNDKPIGTRYLSINNPAEFFPTVSLCGNGYDVELRVYWQNRIAQAPVFSFSNLEHWCLPEDCTVDMETHTVSVKEHQKTAVIQCPHSLDHNFNHFEIEVLDEFGGDCPPPVVALTAACTRDNMEMSNFRLEYLRFWAIGEAEKAMRVGDLVGWGMLIPHSQEHLEERMIICYLTINRNIALTRVMFEPPGGLFPLIILPADVNRVKFEFSGVRITSHPITEELVDKLLAEAEDIYKREQEFLSTGKDLDDFQIDKTLLLKPLPKSDDQSETSGESSGNIYNVVQKARSVNSVQKQIRTNKYSGDHQSKACVIL